MSESKNTNTDQDFSFNKNKNQNILELNIDNYEGPLDLLLDLAKTQKVDLMKLHSINLLS